MNSKIIFSAFSISLFLLLNFSVVSAKNVALIVTNVSSLDPIHEQPLYDILTSMNNTVTLVDKNSNVNLNNFNLMVVAGRPASGTPLPSSFAQNLPVNSVPTIALDYYNLYSWGWSPTSGVSDMRSGSVQSIIIATSNHPITAGYQLNQRVYVHNQTGLDMTDIQKGSSNFTFVAYVDSQGDGGIGYVAPNTILANGKSISANSAAIFFGISYPAYWTSDTVTIFENAVNWLTNINYSPPSVPVLSGPSMATTGTATYTWTASSGANGVQSYEIQISSTSDFTQIIVDTTTPSLSYTYSRLQDGNPYFIRVRAIDFVNLRSQWSNVINTIADFVPIIIKIYSPSNGAALQMGQNVFVNVSATSRRLQSTSQCTFNIDQDIVGSLPYNQTIDSCVGNILIPQTLTPGSSSANFIASISDQYGGTNSTSIPITINRPASSTTITQTTSIISSSGSSGSSTSTSYYTIFDIVTPDSISDFVNTDHTFTIIAKNDGNTDLHATKVSIVPEGNAFTASMNPSGTFDLSAGQSKTYTVTIHTPSTLGNYYLDVRSLSYETAETVRRIPIHVIEQPVVVDYGITSIEIPDFVQGVTSLANLTIINKGNVPGTLDINLTLPEGWTASSSTASVDIIPNQQATLAFEITPSLTAGNLTFSGTFSANGTAKEFSYPVPVSAKSTPNPLASITGALVTVFENPTIAIPTIIAAAVIFALYYKFRTVESFSKYVWPKGIKSSLGSVTPKPNQRNNFKIKKIIPGVASSPSRNNAYEKWERKSRFG